MLHPHLFSLRVAYPDWSTTGLMHGLPPLEWVGQLVHNLEPGQCIQRRYSWYVNRQEFSRDDIFGNNELKHLSVVVNPDPSVFSQTLRNNNCHKQLTSVLASEMVQHRPLGCNA